MLPDWVSNPGPLTYESGALPIALCGPARNWKGNGYDIGGYNECHLSQTGRKITLQSSFL